MKYLKVFNTTSDALDFELTLNYLPCVTLTSNDQEIEDILNYFYDKDDLLVNDNTNSGVMGDNNSIFPLSITYNSSSNYTDIFNKLKNYIEVNASNNAPQGFYQYEMSLNTGNIVLSKNSKTYNISYIMLITAPNNQLYVQLYEINGQMPYWEISSSGVINEID